MVRIVYTADDVRVVPTVGQFQHPGTKFFKRSLVLAVVVVDEKFRIDLHAGLLGPFRRVTR